MFKPSFTKTAVLLASVLMAGSVTAKEMKVGVVNVRAVFSQIPQTAKVQEALKTEFGAKFEEMQKLENDLKFNIEKFKWFEEALFAVKTKESLPLYENVKIVEVKLE